MEYTKAMYQEKIKSYHSFDDMGLHENLLRGIYAYGYEKPSYIQQKAIVPFTRGRDLLLQSPMGTGKTATCMIGALQRIDYSKNVTQALLLFPTRTLAVPVDHIIRTIGSFQHVTSYACVGGKPVTETNKELAEGKQVVVGTPIRILDSIYRKFLDVSTVKVVVVDEVDYMVSIGFLDQLNAIFALLPKDVQVVIITLTLPQDVMEFCEKYLQKPLKIINANTELTFECTHHYHLNVQQEELKLETVCNLFHSLNTSQSIIYCASRRKAEWLSAKLSGAGITVSCIYGDSNENRDVALRNFRSGAVRVLIATDSAGAIYSEINISSVSLMVNYDLPSNVEAYLKRTGRKSGYASKAISVSFVKLVTAATVQDLKDLEKFYSIAIPELPTNISWIHNAVYYHLNIEIETFAILCYTANHQLTTTQIGWVSSEKTGYLCQRKFHVWN